MNRLRQYPVMGRRMKAVPVVLVLLLAVAPPAVPQDLKLGARAGLSLTRLGDDADTDVQTGFAVGAFLGASLADWLAVYPELAFVRKGGKSVSVAYGVDPVTGNPVETSLTETTGADYVQLGVPGAVTIPLSRSGATLFRLNIGPFVGLRARCSYTRDSETTAAANSSTPPCAPDSGYCYGMVTGCGMRYKRFDFGFVLGGGIDLGIGRGALTGDVRYELGLADIAEGEGSVKTRALLLLIGYSHPFVLGNDS